MDSFVVNLSDPWPQIPETSLDLELADSAAAAELTGHAKVKDTLLLLLSSKSFEEICSMDRKIELRPVVERLNLIIGKGKVRKLFYRIVSVEDGGAYEQILNRTRSMPCMRGISGGESRPRRRSSRFRAGSFLSTWPNQDSIIRGRMPCSKSSTSFSRLCPAPGHLHAQTCGREPHFHRHVQVGDFCARCRPTSINIFKFDPLRGNTLLVVDTAWSLPGGDFLRGAVASPDRGRDFTPIEQSIISGGHDHPGNLEEPGGRCMRSGSNCCARKSSRSSQHCPAQDVVVVIPFEVELVNALGSMVLACPTQHRAHTLQAVRAFQTERLEIDHAWISPFRDCSWRTRWTSRDFWHGEMTATAPGFKVGDILLWTSRGRHADRAYPWHPQFFRPAWFCQGKLGFKVI
jgi:flagellar motor switch protein FliM